MRSKIKHVVGAWLGMLCMASAAAPPLIPIEQRAAYWRARAELESSQRAFEQAQAKVTAAVSVIQKTCGTLQVVLGPDGEPICSAPEEKTK